MGIGHLGLRSHGMENTWDTGPIGCGTIWAWAPGDITPTGVVLGTLAHGTDGVWYITFLGFVYTLMV